MKDIRTKTGIELLDRHHEKLLSIIDMLEDADCNAENKCDELKRIFYKLGFYIESYFLDEEMLFKKHGYKNLSVHKADHKAFIERVRKIQRNFLNGSQNTCKELLDFLKPWYEQHIINYDNEAVDFLQKYGSD